MLRTAAALLTLAFSTVAPAQEQPEAASTTTVAARDDRIAAPLPADQAAMKAHVMFLASDAMRGREAGSPEYDIAAQYVAAQFYAAGLRPAGDEGGYLQRVPLVSYKMADKGNFVLTDRDGAPQPLVFGEDVVPIPNPASAETSVNAGLVFVGYGVDAPQYGHDDYRGINARGKIVVLAGGAPAHFGGEERAFFGAPATKARMAAAHGASGVLLLGNMGGTPEEFRRAADNIDRPRITWARPDGTGRDETPGTPILGTLSAAGGARLFGRQWETVRRQALTDDAAFRPMALPGVLSVATKTLFFPMASSNVAGVIPGGDPVVGRQVVILSAHLDHIGVGRPVNGDAINNGALDNAIGIASLIEEAKRFAASGERPRRTVMFLAVTAEEKGLIGSDYFANNPTVPLKDIVADVNLDMPILTYRFEDMTVFGAERSTLGPIVAKAVAALGVGLSPDPMPAEGIFVRSDHFRFVQKGIPSVFLWPGQKGPGKAAVAAFLGNCYHRPCDDLSQPILWDQGVRFVDANYRIAREIADGAAVPVWNKGDYFGTLFKGPMAK